MTGMRILFLDKCHSYVLKFKKRRYMGKKTRIVLLSITAAVTAFAFVAMWVVRPGSQDAVLEAARERQNEPLLSVAEPLETDVAVLTAEEEMAEKVAAILSEDEAFISSLSQSIAGLISLDDYIPEITEAVFNRVSEDYDTIASSAAAIVDSGFEEKAIDLYEKYKKAITADIVLAILNEYDSLTPEEKSDVLVLREQLEMLYAEYRRAIISDIESGILSDYAALEPAEQVSVLGLEDIYASYREAIIADILASIPASELDEAAVEALAARLYEENREAIVSDIENAIIADYSSLDDEGKAALIGLEHDITAEAVALYDEYREVIAEDIASIIGAEEVAEASFEGPAIIEEEPAEVEEPVIIEEPAEVEEPAIIEEPAEVEEPAIIEEPAEVEEEPAVPAKAPISNPVFPESGVIAPDAGAEDYAAARNEMRKSAIAEALSFIQ